MKHWLHGLVVALTLAGLHYGIDFWHRVREHERLRETRNEDRARMRRAHAEIDRQVEELPPRERATAEQIIRERRQDQLETLNAPVPMPPDPVHWLDRVVLALLVGGGVTLGSYLRRRRVDQKLVDPF